MPIYQIDGLTPAIIRQALEQTKNARYYILDEVMLKAISEPRAEISPYAPKIINMQIPVDKIRDVIGSGGKVIQGIVAETDSKIEIEDDGSVYIAAVNVEMGEKAKKMIENIVKDPEPGDIYEGKVVKVMDFGAFVELTPGRDGMIHISKLARHRVNKVTDVVNEGDIVKVVVLDIDDRGRINLRKID